MENRVKPSLARRIAQAFGLLPPPGSVGPWYVYFSQELGPNLSEEFQTGPFARLEDALVEKRALGAHTNHYDLLIRSTPDPRRKLIPAAVVIGLLLEAFGPAQAETPSAYPPGAPGLVRPDLTLTQACQTSWGKDHRAVTARMKREVFLRDGLSPSDCIPDSHGRKCEIDHRVPREIGGADDTRNLWVMSYGGEWNASQKDRLENKVHQLVCRGDLTLVEGQSIFLDPDWHQWFEKLVLGVGR